jgi:hypothetical protein
MDGFLTWLLPVLLLLGDQVVAWLTNLLAALGGG